MQWRMIWLATAATTTALGVGHAQPGGVRGEVYVTEDGRRHASVDAACAGCDGDCELDAMARPAGTPTPVYCHNRRQLRGDPALDDLASRPGTAGCRVLGARDRCFADQANACRDIGCGSGHCASVPGGRNAPLRASCEAVRSRRVEHQSDACREVGDGCFRTHEEACASIGCALSICTSLQSMPSRASCAAGQLELTDASIGSGVVTVRVANPYSEETALEAPRAVAVVGETRVPLTIRGLRVDGREVSRFERTQLPGGRAVSLEIRFDDASLPAQLRGASEVELALFVGGAAERSVRARRVSAGRRSR